MEEYTNSFTKWCTDNIMKADSATGTLPSGPVLVERIDCAIGFLLNDAAQQNRGEVFDPERLTAARLEKMNKSQLISLVLNFAWFSNKTMSPCFRELQDQITEQATSASQRDEHLVEVQANCTVVQHTLAHGNEKLYTHCVQCQSYTELYWTPWLPPPGVFRGHFGVVSESKFDRIAVSVWALVMG